MLRKETKFLFIITVLFLPYTVTILNFQSITAEETITKDYNLTNQTWTFIEITNLTEEQLLDYEWLSELEVQGNLVTSEQYTTLQTLGLSERSEYFETMGYIEGKYDNGRTYSSSSGEIWFVFYNPQIESSSLTINIDYRSSSYAPWKIGLISAVVAIILLSIALYIAMKLRKKMIQEQLEEANDDPAQKYLR